MKARITRWELVKAGDTVLRNGRLIEVAKTTLAWGQMTVYFSDDGERHARVNPEELVAVRE